ncbi:hypothetical protein [Ornithinimicrobium kibberense]|uniref:hypothetical protein n=1 Tax=Ornithinimicrobium kibberense TaxID=282060 RepID=UPI0036087804
MQQPLHPRSHLVEQDVPVERQRQAQVGGDTQRVTDPRQLDGRVEQGQDRHPTEPFVADSEGQQAAAPRREVAAVAHGGRPLGQPALHLIAEARRDALRCDGPGREDEPLGERLEGCLGIDTPRGVVGQRRWKPCGTPSPRGEDVVGEPAHARVSRLDLSVRVDLLGREPRTEEPLQQPAPGTKLVLDPALDVIALHQLEDVWRTAPVLQDLLGAECLGDGCLCQVVLHVRRGDSHGVPLRGEHAVTVGAGSQSLRPSHHSPQLRLSRVLRRRRVDEVTTEEGSSHLAHRVLHGARPALSGQHLDSVQEVGVVLVALRLVGQGVHLERRCRQQQRTGRALLARTLDLDRPQQRLDEHRRIVVPGKELAEALELVEDHQIRSQMPDRDGGQGLSKAADQAVALGRDRVVNP